MHGILMGPDYGTLVMAGCTYQVYQVWLSCYKSDVAAAQWAVCNSALCSTVDGTTY